MEPPVNAAVAANGRGLNENWALFETLETEHDFDQWAVNNRFAKGRTIHNLGSRALYLRCRHIGCPMRHRCLRTFNPPTFQVYHIPGLEHDHNNDIVLKGLTWRQKAIVDACLARGDSAPKKV